MAHYHAHVRPGPRGKGAEHAQYIERGGRFKVERYGEIGEHERGNLPEWAQGSAARFFAAADQYERANGNAYREFELALPVELSDAERGALVRAFVAEQLGERHAYAWAIHEPQGHNPHVHIMFSERVRDGIERRPEQYFKRANAKHPELGGTPKPEWFTGHGGPAAVEALRARWAEVQNLVLERAGHEVRVDHRSLEAQGIEREAGQHRGPAISGLEARGQEAEVSMRREAERALRQEAVLRQPEHQELIIELREVTREEVAGQRAAARERRELLPETDGELRKDLEHQVESDRREQIARVEAQVERRIERRMGLAGRWGEKLLEQARALRDRVLELGGRVKDWVRERFPDPMGQLKEHARELFGARAMGRGGREGEQEKAAGRADAGPPEKVRAAPGWDVERTAKPTPGAMTPAVSSGSERLLDPAERAQVLKDAAALGRQELTRQVQAVRQEQAARQRLDELVRQERERQRVRQLELERQRELERVRELELERKRDRGRGLGD